MEITTFTHMLNVRGRNQQCTVDQLARALTHPVASGCEKKNIPMWSPTTFNGTRAGANAVAVHCLVYDMDDGLTAFDSWRLFGDWQVIAHTSYSHKPHWHKYRIVLPLAQPIPVADWGRAATAANELWADVVGRGIPDQSAINDCARAYYRYTIPEATRTESHPMHTGHYHQTAVYLDAPPLRLDYSHIPVPKRFVRPKTRQTTLRGTETKTVRMAMLDPAVRIEVANQIGATINGNTVRNIHCPNCGQPEVYYTIDPDTVGGVVWPRCNRQNKCGWYGTLEDLIK